jgi:hypothetical protein
MLNAVSVSYFSSDITSNEPGSSVSIVSGYGLDDRVIDVRSLAQAGGFFL